MRVIVIADFAVATGGAQRVAHFLLVGDQVDVYKKKRGESKPAAGSAKGAAPARSRTIGSRSIASSTS